MSRGRAGCAYWETTLAGRIRETGPGMEFQYDDAWLHNPESAPVSLTLPLRGDPYAASGPHPFFAGLLPEGWLFGIALSKLKLVRDDWFGQLVTICRDCIGAVSIRPDAPREDDEWQLSGLPSPERRRLSPALPAASHGFAQAGVDRG